MVERRFPKLPRVAAAALLVVVVEGCDCGGPSSVDGGQDPSAMDALSDDVRTESDVGTESDVSAEVDAALCPASVTRGRTCRSDGDCNGSMCSARGPGGQCDSCTSDATCPDGFICFELLPGGMALPSRCYQPCVTSADCRGTLEECDEVEGMGRFCQPVRCDDACPCPEGYDCAFGRCSGALCGGGRPPCPEGWTCAESFCREPS